jgi:hypothetical protein
MILAPIAWVAWEAKGWKALKDRGLMIGTSAAVACIALWYWHADSIYHRTGLSEAIWHPSGNYAPPIATVAGKFIGIYHWSTRASLTDPAFYQDMLTRLWALHLTPAGFALILFALLATWHWPRRHVLDAWFGVVVLFVLVTIEGNRHHEFHQLPLLPPAALFFGLVAAPAFDGAWLRPCRRACPRRGRQRRHARRDRAPVVHVQRRRGRLLPAGSARQDSDRRRRVAPARRRSRRAARDGGIRGVRQQLGDSSLLGAPARMELRQDVDHAGSHRAVAEGFRRALFVTTIAPVLEGTRPDVFNYLKTKRRVQLPDAPRDTVLNDLTEPAGGS